MVLVKWNVTFCVCVACSLMFSCPGDIGIIAVARRQVSGQGNQLISLQSLVLDSSHLCLLLFYSRLSLIASNSAGIAGIPGICVPYLSALEVCSRRGAIQIHVYLTLPYHYCKVMAAVKMLAYVMKQLQTAVPQGDHFFSTMIFHDFSMTYRHSIFLWNTWYTIYECLPV